jgi:hypothetical protein
MRILCSLVLAVLVIAPVLGCGGEQETGEGAVERAVGEAGSAVQEAASGAIEQAGEQVMAAVEQYKTGAMAKLDQYTSGLSALKESAGSLGNEELDGMVQGIEEKLGNVRSELTDLAPADLGELDTFKGQMDAKLDEIGGDIEGAQQKLRDLGGSLPQIPGQG